MRSAAHAPLEEQMTLRLAQADVDRLNALEVVIPIASRNAIAREALRIGLGQLERNPGLLLRAPVQAPRARGTKR